MPHQFSNLPLVIQAQNSSLEVFRIVPDLALLWQVPQLLTPPSPGNRFPFALRTCLTLSVGCSSPPGRKPTFFLFWCSSSFFLAADRRSPAAFHQDFSNFNLAYAQSQSRTTESLNTQKSDHCNLFNLFCLDHFPILQVIMGNSATDGKADADRGKVFRRSLPLSLIFLKGSHIFVLQCVRIAYDLEKSFKAHRNVS